MATQREYEAYAKAHQTCFACRHYRGAFKLKSATCALGGLNPDDPRAWRDRQAHATVLWANTCPRWAAAFAQQVAA